LQARVGVGKMPVNRFHTGGGPFAFEKGASISWTEGSSTVTADAITVGASNVHVFVGIGGPYWKDSNNDGVINSSDTPDSDGAIRPEERRAGRVWSIRWRHMASVIV